LTSNSETGIKPGMRNPRDIAQGSTRDGINLTGITTRDGINLTGITNTPRV